MGTILAWISSLCYIYICSAPHQVLPLLILSHLNPITSTSLTSKACLPNCYFSRQPNRTVKLTALVFLPTLIMDSPASKTLRYWVIPDGEMIKHHEVYGSDPDGAIKQHPSFKAQTIWDMQTAKQAKESIGTDNDKHFMQQYNKDDPIPCFAVEFPSLGFVCYWSNLQYGVSQWLRGPLSGSSPDVKDILYERTELYEHRSFRRRLVSVPTKVCSYLSALLILTPPMNCGCNECQRRTTHDTYTIAVHIDNKDNPRPLPGAKYLVLSVCNRLRVRDFFIILKGSVQRCRAGNYFQQIVGSINDPETCEYGQRYSYGDYITGDLRMGDLGLVLGPDGGKVLMAMG